MSVQAPGGEIVLVDGFVFVEHIRLRLEELIRVIRTAITFATAEIGHQWIGNPDLAFPALFVEFDADSSVQDVIGGPTHLVLGGEALMYVVGDDRTRMALQTTLAVDALRKLFSNNALGDVSTPTATGRWRANDTPLGAPPDPENRAWYEIETSFKVSRSMRFTETEGRKLMRSIRMGYTMRSYAIL